MRKTDLHILMLEDEPMDAELNIAQLDQLEEYNCIVNLVADRYSYIDALENTHPDIILSDYNLPQYNGLKALQDLNDRKLLIPFIFVTGALSEEIAADTIKSGAWDYVVKDRLFRLPLAVRSALKLREEKLVVAAAEEKVKRLLAAIDQSSAQIIVSDENGFVDYVNNKFTEVTGFLPDEVLGKEAIELSYDNSEPGSIKASIEMLKKGETYKGELLTRKKDGSAIWELVSIAPIFNSEGRVSSFVAVKEDITQRKQMEQQLKDAFDKVERSDKLKDAFLQNLSHEIRTPLNAIVGFSDLLDKSVDSKNEKLKEYTSIIHQSSNQLLLIVTDILTISIIETGQEKTNIRPVNLKKIIDHLIEIFYPLARIKNLSISIIPDPGENECIILTDEIKLLQILTNLLNNAIKFTHKGWVELKWSVENGTLNFYVKDTGIGISKEAQNFIFERFRQADDSIHLEYGGTGLGLSISKAYAEMLDGKISVESKHGKGSLFTLSLPYNQVSESVHEKPHPPFLRNRPFTVLVTEDEITNFVLLKEYLNHPDINILYAENGRDAVEICEKNKAIDLVLMDIKMPVMNGIEAFEKIHEMRPDLPVIAQTAYGLESEKSQILKAGFNGYLDKPIKKDNLWNMIRLYII